VTPSALGILVTVAVLAAATCLGVWHKGRQGRMRSVSSAGPRADTLVALGVEPGGVTLLQFSSAFCAPCRATRRVLADVAEGVEGVRHLEVDAESHLDAVRALGIWKTPTTLVVDAEGRIIQRAAGVPAKAQVYAAVAPLLEGATR
jgi:thiol-disulfide isomerase/thioredoxin